MANIKSAEKRNRQRLKRRAHNQHHLSTARTYVKHVRTALEAKDAGQTKETLAVAIAVLDKAAQKGVINRKTASRKISRLTLASNKIA